MVKNIFGIFPFEDLSLFTTVIKTSSNCSVLSALLINLILQLIECNKHIDLNSEIKLIIRENRVIIKYGSEIYLWIKILIKISYNTKYVRYIIIATKAKI